MIQNFRLENTEKIPTQKKNKNNHDSSSSRKRKKTKKKCVLDAKKTFE